MSKLELVFMLFSFLVIFLINFGGEQISLGSSIPNSILDPSQQVLDVEYTLTFGRDPPFNFLFRKSEVDTDLTEEEIIVADKLKTFDSTLSPEESEKLAVYLTVPYGTSLLVPLY